MGSHYLQMSLHLSVSARIPLRGTCNNLHFISANQAGRSFSMIARTLDCSTAVLMSEAENQLAAATSRFDDTLRKTEDQ